MKTYDFQVHVSGNVRIDSNSEAEAREEFEKTFSQEAVLITAREDQILVLSGMAWEDPTIYVDPDEEEEDIEEAEIVAEEEEEVTL